MWLPAQFTVDGGKDFYIAMEGQATNGGFGVDDIVITPGSCPSKLAVSSCPLPVSIISNILKIDYL